MISKSTFKKIKKHPLALLTLLWIISLFIVNPTGNFPLNDDWAYTHSVKNLLDNGQYKVINWPAMTLFLQICWGTLFTTLFGFSFEVLRVSTFVLAILGIWTFDKILQRLHFSSLSRLIASAVLLFNPLYYHLSLTFMTDIPFITMMLMSCLFFLYYLEEEDFIWWAIALSFSIAAILIRQLGLFIPLAFFAATLFRYKTTKKSTILLCFLAVLLTYGALQLYIYWQVNTVGLPTPFSKTTDIIKQFTIQQGVFFLQRYTASFVLYLSVFLLPVVWLNNRWQYKFHTLILGSILLFFIGIKLYTRSTLILGNTMYNLGIGALTLPDNMRSLHLPDTLSPFALNAILLLGYIICLLLINTIVPLLFKGIKRYKENSRSIYTFLLGVFFFILGYLFFLYFNVVKFDRYLLPLVPFLLILVVPRQIHWNKWQRSFSLGSFFLLISFSVLGTHDYFSWNRTRWAAATQLEASGISPKQIDGGFEYNGWHSPSSQRSLIPHGKGWWFVNGDDYVIARDTFHEYRVKEVHPFTRLWPFSKDTIYSLERPDYYIMDTMFTSMHPSEDTIAQYNQFRKDSFESYITKDTAAFSGEYLSSFAADHHYAFQYLLTDIKPLDRLRITVRVRGNGRAINVVNSAPNYYFAYNLIPTYTQENNWILHELDMLIPRHFKSDSLDLYFWKPTDTEILLDDLTIIHKRIKE